MLIVYNGCMLPRNRCMGHLMVNEFLSPSKNYTWTVPECDPVDHLILFPNLKQRFPVRRHPRPSGNSIRSFGKIFYDVGCQNSFIFLWLWWRRGNRLFLFRFRRSTRLPLCAVVLDNFSIFLIFLSFIISGFHLIVIAHILLLGLALSFLFFLFILFILFFLFLLLLILSSMFFLRATVYISVILIFVAVFSFALPATHQPTK
mmetsp:Transcript_18168/g.34644  ORF Transcript_18168/g.34644 Transcript_18168/m.34644 type:complete len:203 (-) Transcript_18168:1-609(-)